MTFNFLKHLTAIIVFYSGVSVNTNCMAPTATDIMTGLPK
jgi:hypothetical protein